MTPYMLRYTNGMRSLHQSAGLPLWMVFLFAFCCSFDCFCRCFCYYAAAAVPAAFAVVLSLGVFCSVSLLQAPAFVAAFELVLVLFEGKCFCCFFVLKHAPMSQVRSGEEKFNVCASTCPLAGECVCEFE